ncbi:MAG: cupin domain-containing protein [Desulfomonilaceae bacterium]
MQKLLPYTIKSDDRGVFLGITQDAWAEVNYVKTTAGQTRGNHYHKHIRELFFIISGEIRIVVQDLNSGETTTFTSRGGEILIIEPNELHSFHTITESQWINALSSPLDDKSPDIHRPEGP